MHVNAQSTIEPPPPAPPDVATRGSKRPLWAAAGGVLIFCVLLWLIDLKRMHGWAEGLPAVGVVLMLFFVPLTGIPATLLYMIVGARFGPVWGNVWAAGAIAFHLVASFWIASTPLGGALRNWMRRRGYQLPSLGTSGHVSVCLLTALVPGVPYTLKNYMLPLAGVPFRPYFFACWPAHVSHGALAIVFGDSSEGFTTGRVVFLVTYGLVLTILGHFVVRQLRSARGRDSTS